MVGFFSAENYFIMKHCIKKTELTCENCSKQFKRRDDAIELYKEKCDGRILCKNCYGGLNKKKKRKVLNPTAKESGRFSPRGNPYYTITCKYCGKEFEVKYAERSREFCCKSCQTKGSDRVSIKGKSSCLVCGKEFNHYGAHIVCGRKCFAKYMSDVRWGENNPNWIPREDMEKSKCPTCGKIFSYGRANLHKGQKRYFCSLKCCRTFGANKYKKVENKEGLIINSKEYDNFIEYDSNPYPSNWTDELKDKIKTRDGHCCQLCGVKEDLEVHHVDYIKDNCEDNNLITLCKKCHNITNHNRQFWTQVFVGLYSNSKIVKKGWGAEIIFVNNNKYCLKYLIFFKNKRFSLHHHDKQELWLCSWGKFECYLKNLVTGEEDYHIFKRGEKIEVLPGIDHQLRALTNSILVEVSTRDYPEDSARTEKGD